MVGGVGPPGGGMDPSMMVQMMRQRFNQSDANGDGAVSKEEFTLPEPPDGVQGPSADEMFNNLDANGDGVISQEELEAHLQQMQEQGGRSKADGPPEPPSFADILARDDADGSGTISRDEFAIPERPDGARGPSADELFDLIDADGNGEIDEEEHEAHIKEMRERMQSMEQFRQQAGANWSDSSSATTSLLDLLG